VGEVGLVVGWGLGREKRVWLDGWGSLFAGWLGVVLMYVCVYACACV